VSYDQTDDRVDSKELLVIKQVKPEPASGESKYGKNGYTIRVVQWLYAGKGKNKGSVQASTSLEKREFYLTEDGDLRTGKSKGLQLLDLIEVQQKWKEIVAILKDPPAPAWPSTSSSKKKEEPTQQAVDGLEEISF
jgi:hypothetical protein